MSYGYISYPICMYIYIIIYLTMNAHRKRGTSIKIPWVLSYDHSTSHRFRVIGVYTVPGSPIFDWGVTQLFGCAHHAEDDAGHHGAALQQPLMRRFRRDQPATLNGNCRIQLIGGTLVPYVWPYFVGIFPEI